MPLDPTIHQALQRLRHTLPAAAETLQLDLGDAFAHWVQTLDHKLLPRMAPDFPLIAAICGGGSAGKSTLFNALTKTEVSPVGGRAGLNRRVLVGAHADQRSNHDFATALEQTFGAMAEPLEDPELLLSPGNPLLSTDSALPGNIVLLDTPDIDTGSGGHYANRDMARHSLEVADLFVYVFTNATYNNRENTDFIAKMLTGMGTRPCYLVYRVYSGFGDEEVLSHARTVAHNIYGELSDRHLLGIYRADEDNDVAAGHKPMSLQPVWGADTDLSVALGALDISALRRRLLNSMLADTLDMAANMLVQIRQAAGDLANYRHTMQAAQSRAIQQVLSHFPADRVLRRFAQIWMASDPSHIKLMRRTGRIVGWPMRTLLKATRKVNTGSVSAAKPSERAMEQHVESDLLRAANALHQACLDSHYTVKNQRLMAPAAIQPARTQLSNRSWQSALGTILAQKEQVLSWSSQLDEDLEVLARDLRARMSLFDQFRQTFSALLNVIPATAAITYILHTGDPVGAAGIKVKLTGLLGLHDLYALVAIPATAGLSKTDQQQLELLLKPLVRTWLAHKYQFVQELFEAHISGSLLDSAERAHTKSNDLMAQTEQALAQCRR